MMWSLAAVLVGAYVASTVYAIFAGDAGTAAWALVILPAAVFVWYLATGYIDLYDDRVVIDGRFRRHREIPLSNIQGVEPRSGGLFFRTGPYEGELGPGMIGAKGLGLTVLHAQSRGDRIAEAIMNRATSSGGVAGQAH